ncbi:MAG TPA: efflux RND transporter periplasmic adaptor subunit [Methyloceanibacter sp.]|nr:efflux RND transporter periplasmic adaptor subunit [Methyloceanibacter sp.]
MRRLDNLMILAIGVFAGALGGYWLERRSEPLTTPAIAEQSPPSQESKQEGRKILYYRNPMGLPDTSPVPKKDSMGMDYIPVYADEVDDPNAVKVSLDKVQRSGVKTEKVGTHNLSRTVRAVGMVDHDETLLTVVAMRSDGYVEDLFVNKTGQHVKQGEPLFRVYSPQIQQAQTDLIVALKADARKGADADKAIQGAVQRLRNLGVPESRIEEIKKTQLNPRTLDWPAPAEGDVIEKMIVNGQRVAAGEELYRIADHSRVWLIADVAEADIASIELGMGAVVTLRAMPMQPIEGRVTFIYPVLKPETRTVSVRIELPNPDGLLKPGMYADVVFEVRDGETVTAVPNSAVIDSGTRQVVLVAAGGGRFEPRAVKLGRRGTGFVEILEGLDTGEEVVTSATFLIDAESNLRAALQSFSQDAQP